jgi:hypothetical protein
MKKIFSILVIIICLFTVFFFINKGDIDGFKENLNEENIKFKEVSINKNSTFDERLLGKKPHHLEFTSEDFFHIYKYPSKSFAQKARNTFTEKTASMDMVAHNLYLVEDMFIIYEYQRNVDDVDRSLSKIITEYEE